MENQIWTLTIRTSLPKVAKNKMDVKTTEVAFTCFDNAKAALREKLKEYAFSKNEMFDGEGKLVHLEGYADEIVCDEDNDFENLSALSGNTLKEVSMALLHIFNGEDCPLQLDEVKACTDWMIALDVNEDSISIYGYDDGPFNGYNPFIKTNMFDMTKEKDYYLYIDDMLGQDYSSELYVDLRKVEVK